MIYLIKDPQDTIQAIATREQDARAMTKTLNNEPDLRMEEYQPSAPTNQTDSPQS